MAREFGVPFYALVQDPRSLQSGDDVSIEERPAEELLSFRGEKIAGDAEVGARYPSFDVTPAALIDHLVGFEDIYTPETFRRKYQTAPAAARAAANSAQRYLLIYGVPPPSQYAFLLSALKAEKAAGMLLPEMRPELWGARKIARELSARRAPVILISDNTMGTLFRRGEILKLYLFYTGMSEAGPVGICGSLLAAQLARLHGVPVELFDGAGSDAPLDQDVATFMGTRICPSGVSVLALEPEIIPWSLFRAHE
jgi:methylthioribose-1-phosphate isomerase